MNNWNVAYDDPICDHYRQISLYSLHNDIWHYIGPATVIWENCKTSSEVLVWIICHPSISQVVFSSISQHSSSSHLPSDLSSSLLPSLSVELQSEFCQLSLRGKNTFSLLSSLFSDFNTDCITSSSTLFPLRFSVISSHTPYLAPEYYSAVNELRIQPPPRAFFLHSSSSSTTSFTKLFERERENIHGYEMQLLEEQIHQLSDQSQPDQPQSERMEIIHLVGICQPGAQFCQAMGGVDLLIPRAAMKQIWNRLVNMSVMIVGIERVQ